MSTKLPVGETINEAFQFGLHRWGAVLRFGWLPIVAMFAFMFLFVFLIIDFAALPAPEEQVESIEELRNILRFPIPVVVVLSVVAYALIFFVLSGVLASIYRLAALGEERRGLFHFRMDGPAKRVFFALVILFVINLVVWSVALNVGLSLTGSSWGEVFGGYWRLIELSATTEASDSISMEEFAALSEPFRAFGLSLLIAAVPLIYINVKLVPFAAGSAAENRLLLIGSFVMTTGHFWSIIGIWILLILVMIIMAIIFQIVMAIVTMLATFLIDQGSALAIVGAALMFIYIAGSLWYSAFIYALQFGLQGIIYRRLNTGA